MVRKSPHDAFDLTSIAILTTIALIFSFLVALLCYCIDLCIRCRNSSLIFANSSTTSTTSVEGHANFVPTPNYLNAPISPSNSFDEIVLVILPNEKHVNYACAKPIDQVYDEEQNSSSANNVYV